MPEDFSKYFVNQQNEIMEPSSIKENVQTEEIVHKVITAIQPMFVRLTSEVQSLRKELQGRKKEKTKTNSMLMPSEPFKDIEAFLEFEKGFQENRENFISLEN
ncbi:uncharacterized protein [Musca autumnalis]|uniref:uncharacterized protein n=1 Tax=Musca autumnalis TaxID=221902 RepID=UPI003CE6B6BE